MSNYWESTGKYMGTRGHAGLLATWLPSCRWDNRYIGMIDHRKTKKKFTNYTPGAKNSRVKYHKPLHTVDSAPYYLHCTLTLFIKDNK